jgi:hypothetical protein
MSYALRTMFMIAARFPLSQKAAKSRHRTYGVPLAALVLCVLSGAAAAAMYKWTDANGRVVYSDQPPPAGVKVEPVNVTPPPANPNAVRDMAIQETELRKRQGERAQSDEKNAQSRADADKRVAACARAKTQAADLGANQVLISRINDKGERVILDEAARQKERETLERWIKSNCPG